MKELCELLDYSTFIKNKKEIKEKLLENTYLIEKKIAILCGSTVGEIKELITIFLLYYGIKPVFWEGNYNRYYEDACFSNSSLLEFAPDFILLHITSRNLLYNTETSIKQMGEILERDKERLRQIWMSLEEKYNCDIIQNNFEYFPYRIIGNGARTYEEGNVKYIDDLNYYISSYAREKRNFYVNDVNYIAAYVGLEKWYDDRMWNLYKCPMAMDVMPRYALSIVNIIKSVLGKNKKTIITDLDNTLWGGVIGEVGAENILLGKETSRGETFCELHKYLRTLSLNGILLNICSKNEYETGISGLKNQNSILKDEDFLVKKINWSNKPDNIREIISELNILEDSVVYLDDDFVECDSVSSMLPNIETLQVTDVYKLLKKMDAMSYFEVTNITDEDRRRQRFYKREMSRNEERRKFADYEDYLKALKIKCRTGSVNKDNIERVVQLFNKTNQFNFMSNRYTITEMTKLYDSSEAEILVLETEDKFGDNGIVAVSIIRFEKEEAHICDWIMSCRVFERGLEYEMLKQICRKCLENKVNCLYGYYKETSKNKKIFDFYNSLNFEKDLESDRWIYRDIGSLYRTMEAKTSYIEEIE